MGAKYLEPGSRSAIGVRRLVQPDGGERFKIFQGRELYKGRVGNRYVADKTWNSEGEAQHYLDLLAKMRNWKKVKA